MQLTVSMIRALKGAPLSILLALSIDRQPRSQSWLSAATGYSVDVVASGLRVLNDVYHLVTQNGRYAWQIASSAQQLPLMALPEDDTQEPDSAKNGVPQPPPPQNDSEKIGVPAAAPAAKRPKSAPTPQKSESDSEKIGVPDSLPIGGGSGLINNQSLNPPPPIRAASETTEIIAALDDAGVAEPTRSQLAALPHITARQIRYHVQDAPTIAAAIYRLRRNWRVPPTWRDPGPPIDVAAIAAASTGENRDILQDEAIDADAITACDLAIEEIAKAYRPVEVSTWLLAASLADHDAATNTYVIGCANPTARAWWIKSAASRLADALTAITGRQATVEIIVS